MKKYLFTLALGISLLFSGQAFAACSETQVAEMTWASGRVVAKIIDFVLTAGYDCKVELLSAGSQSAVASMLEKGKPHILPETWVNSLEEAVNTGVSKGKFKDYGNIFSDGGLETWWIPAYMAETHPKIKTVKDVIENSKVFKDPEDPRKGRFYTCPSGWACSRINKNLAKAYGLDEKFNVFDPGSGENLKASIAKAYARKEPWFGYYWGPTAVLGKYPMMQIKLNAYDAKGHVCNQSDACANPHAGQYPSSSVIKLITKDYAAENKDVVEFVTKMTIPNEVVNAVLAWQEDNSADYSQTAAYFFATYPDLWQGWVTKKALKKLKKVL